MPRSEWQEVGRLRFANVIGTGDTPVHLALWYGVPPGRIAPHWNWSAKVGDIEIAQGYDNGMGDAQIAAITAAVKYRASWRESSSNRHVKMMGTDDGPLFLEVRPVYQEIRDDAPPYFIEAWGWTVKASKFDVAHGTNADLDSAKEAAVAVATEHLTKGG